jgi:hypothetical protein
MKLKTLFLILPILAFAACSQSNKKMDTADIDNNESTPENPAPANGPLGTPSFESTSHDFGKVIDGEKVQHRYSFKNTGKGDLVIAKVQAHCGCTSNEWTRDVIPPGGEGFILATFDSGGKGDKEGIKNEKGVTVEFATSTVPSVELSLISMVYTK